MGVLMINNILNAQEMNEIWRKNESTYDQFQAAAQIGFEKGRIAQLREDNAELNAVLHVVDAQAQKVIIQ
jgi:hypothetical protein